MTAFQRAVLHAVYQNQQAIRFAGQWVFRADVKRDERLAEVMYWSLIREMD